MRTRALNRIERESVRLRVLESLAAGGAHQVAAVIAHLFGSVVVYGHVALALFHRLIQGTRKALRGGLVYRKTVYYEVYVVNLVPVEP